MADTWTIPGGVPTLTLDGTGTGVVAKERTFTAGDGITASKLHTFYLTVNPSVAAVEAFLQVTSADGTTDVATATGSQTLSAQGTADGSGNLTVRFGVQEAGNAPGTFFFEDDLDYADRAALIAGGWTIHETGGGTITVDTSGDLDGNTTSVIKATSASGGAAWIGRSFSTVSLRTYTARCRARSGINYSLDTSTKLQWSPGPDESVNDTTWQDLEVDETTAGTTLEIRLGHFGAPAGLPGAYSGYLHGLTINDHASSGGATVTFDNLTYCLGTGTTTVPPIVVPPVECPPGGCPPPPVGGARPFGIWDIPAEGFSLWTMTAKRVTTSNMVNILNASATGSMQNIIGFGSTEQLLSGGRFSYAKWKALVDACYNNAEINARMDTAITNGEWWAHFILDEPNRVDRWGMEIPFSTIEQMCVYSKTLWPNLRVVLRASPILDWWRRANRHMNGCDTVWGEYLKARGTVQDYVSQHLAACAQYDHTVVFGIHYGAFDRSGTPRNITPSELRQYGGYIAGQTSSRIVGMGGWKFYPALYNQPGFYDALKYVRDLFASHDP